MQATISKMCRGMNPKVFPTFGLAGTLKRGLSVHNVEGLEPGYEHAEDSDVEKDKVRKLDQEATIVKNLARQPSVIAEASRGLKAKQSAVDYKAMLKKGRTKSNVSYAGHENDLDDIGIFSSNENVLNYDDAKTKSEKTSSGGAGR